MANYNFTDSSVAASTDNPSVEWKQTTATLFVTPTWTSATRAVTSTDTTQNNWSFTDTATTEIYTSLFVGSVRCV